MLIWRLAWRGLWRNPRRSGVVVAAVAVGISGCFLTVALNTGMAAQMVDTAIATELGHIQIHARGFDADPELRTTLEDSRERTARRLGDVDGLRAWSRRVRGQGLVNSPRASVGVRVVAVEPDREPRVSNYASSLVEGEWLDGEAHRLVIGEDLARRLKVRVGSKVVLSVQDLAGDLTGQAFRIRGLFRTASSEVNHTTVVMRLDEAQRLFGLGDAISELVLVADRRDRVESVRARLVESFGAGVEIKSWEELQPVLVQLISTLDQMAWVFYAGVFIAMAFGIANVLLMSVYERTREIGVMMAMGMKPPRIVAAVLAESLVVTLLGVALGLGVGVGSVLWLSDGIDLRSFADGLEAIGVGTRVVPVLRPGDLLAPLVMALAAAFIASAWPAVRAAALRPGEALRHV